ncbi:lytic polysaccharide monooxygenase [Dothidotthia symphoricarpi CBS 119687]|uniref:AA9 family lytic polysaccharide monooxygenase n=1 Tax=Dothidotthia symphoricarpi CBS 119687 TaxID=1392245 RepID=A0A6A6A0R2_9PLEO|nr:lytic polysaccharide monooxygenase [Dothidotthia symphoricarpi CBS 119687]KAF2125439.1 lytic polysaccharide monooxygenase [Dothidotthia symphoricarpi CBS 119687]
MKYTVVASTLLASASAHTIFTQLYVNGVGQGQTKGIRVPVRCLWPITDVTSNDDCSPNPLNTPLPKDIINVKAGDKLTTEWHHTLTSTPETDSSDPIDSSHLGPIMIYLAKVDSALTTTVTGLKWFKVYEDGLDSSGVWAVTRLINNKGKMTFTLPSCIANGQYLLRAELIALHAASSYPGAQLYMECAQINVTGGGSAAPATVSFPGAYKGSDPGITFQLYYPKPTSYTIPGPRPLVC